MIPARRPFLASRNSRLCASLTGLCLMGLLLAGCSQNKGLVGRWAGDQTSANTTTNYEVEFRSDDTYSESIDVQMSDNSKPESSSTYRGNFTATAKEVTLEAKEIVQNMESNSASIPPETYSYKIDGNTLVIRTVSGSITLSRRWW